ncbi:EthD family reductase [Haloferax volcanii]|uniref:EthD family reductase n=2 Tax=Haloferax volcanii TaxID=2246 RepID=A0A558GFW3_HALVO|nr:EthD family reductase [Haloferax alexandrinus]TVT96616.1 EthD family reductase [Haloferax volcanii]
MIKLVNMLVRDDDYTHEEFVERWRGNHADLARELPGLVKYATSVPTDPERSEYDGIVELYFEDMAALKAAFDSEVGQRVNADAAAFTDMERGPTLYVEETVHLDRS